MRSFLSYCAAFLGVLLVLFIIAKVSPKSDPSLDTETTHDLSITVETLNSDFQRILDDMTISDELTSSQTADENFPSILVYMLGESQATYADASDAYDTLETHFEAMRSELSHLENKIAELEELQDSYVDIEIKYFQ